jgi:hypothetical protein
LDARSATLLLDNGSRPPRNVLAAADPADAAYAAHFHSVNPYVQKAARDFSQARVAHLGRAKVGAELVPEAEFLRSEYYVDFARPHERRHMIGGVLGVASIAPIALYRGEDSDTFDERHVRLLESLLPHIQRALELRARLGRHNEAEALTRAALDALPAVVVIVDAGLTIRFANRSARTHLSARDAGLYCQRTGPQAGAPVALAARSREDAAALRRLVAATVSGGSGGAMRVLGQNGGSAGLLVSPTPPGLAGDGAAAPAERTAMITIRPLDRQPAPSVDILCDLFGFSRAESEVALALSGGASAIDVAGQRNVSLVTVRSQIRAILGKSESENLRDFERSMATLAAFLPAAAASPAE